MDGISSYLSAYTNPYAIGYSSTQTGFDVSGAQRTANQQAAELMNSLKSNNTEVKSLKADTAKYLDQYALSMKTLEQSTQALRNGGIDKLLYNKSGEVTDTTVNNTVKAVQTMVDSYNSTLKLLNDNADRGPGTMKQLGRMATDPAPEASMEMVGITVNKDGTLALDSAKMTEALKTTDANQLKLHKDIIGGYGGVADGAHKDALYGMQAPARQLVQNDLANIQSLRNENPFAQMKASLGGNVYALNNMAVTGLLMNMLV